MRSNGRACRHATTRYVSGIWIFAVVLGWLPTSGTGSTLSWILPIATLLIRPLGHVVVLVPPVAEV